MFSVVSSLTGQLTPLLLLLCLVMALIAYNSAFPQECCEEGTSADKLKLNGCEDLRLCDLHLVLLVKEHCNLKIFFLDLNFPCIT